MQSTTSRKRNSGKNGNVLQSLLIKGTKASFPEKIEPMLATLVDEPFDEPGWIYEVKWDGYRAIAHLNHGEVMIQSRNNKSFNEKFYSVYNSLKQWKINAVLDGEIIVVSKTGVADFSDLQAWRSEADGDLVYYLFDILWLDGYDLMNLSLTGRKQILSLITLPKDNIRVSESFITGAKEFFRVAKEMKLEGIIAKKADGKYSPGSRSKEWLKIKTETRQEAVIGGYTINENTSKKFSALLMGVYDQGDFKFIGPVGTGFSDKLQDEILAKLKPLIIKKCPFNTVPEYNKPSRFRPNPPKAAVTWVKPQVVAEISYRELTRDGALRHTSFKGLRIDKNAEDVTREITVSPPVPTDLDCAFAALDKKRAAEETNSSPTKKLFKVSGKQERRTLLNPKDETQVRTINGHDLKFANLSKIFFPKRKVTKRDVLNYYYQVAPVMLPYMNNRPQTLIRHPNGLKGDSFYQRDVRGKAPEWINTFPYHSVADGRDKEFLVCTDEAHLLYIASLGCLEMHPWSSRVQSPDHPDWCIIDLDPDKNTFDQVIRAAQVTKQVLDAADIPSYPKTSGSTGLHIYIPLGAQYTYEESKEFARVVVKIIHLQIPGYTSIERLTSNRDGKMYLDFLQNRPQATLAAPYSLRPKPDATVSMPLHWEEVKKGLKMKDFTIFNAVARVREQGDLFKGVLGKGINMQKALKKLNEVFGN